MILIKLILNILSLFFKIFQKIGEVKFRKLLRKKTILKMNIFLIG